MENEKRASGRLGKPHSASHFNRKSLETYQNALTYAKYQVSRKTTTSIFCIFIFGAVGAVMILRVIYIPQSDLFSSKLQHLGHPKVIMGRHGHVLSQNGACSLWQVFAIICGWGC